MNPLQPRKIFKKLLQEIFRIMRQIPILHAYQRQSLRQRPVFIIQRKNIDIRRNLVLLTGQAHLGNEAGGQALKADRGSNLGVGACNIGPGYDIGRVKALADLAAHVVVKDTEGQDREILDIRALYGPFLKRLRLFPITGIKQ